MTKRAVDIRSKFLSVLSRALVLGALAIFGATAQADCADFVLGSKPLSEKIYRLSEGKTPVTIGAMPEEVLSYLGGFGGTKGLDSLWLALRAAGVERVRFGSSFKITGWRGGTLVVRRPNFHTPRAQGDAGLELARVLFAEKQRLLRWRLDPSRYLNDMQQFGGLLEDFVYPLVGATAPETLPEYKRRFGAIRYFLGALVGWVPGGGWPANQDAASGWLAGDGPGSGVRRTSALHFAFSRLFLALYISMSAVTISHLPQTYRALEFVYLLHDGIVRNLDSLKDGNSTDVMHSVVERYERKVAQLEAELTTASNPAEIHKKIGEIQAIIRSLEADLALAPSGPAVAKPSP